MNVSLKICGITRRDDMAACCELGVPWVGINLWPKSKRAVTLARAGEVLRPFAGLASAPRRAGVFVDPSVEEVEAAVSELALDVVQLHGDRSLDEYARIKAPLVWVIRGTPDLASIVWPQRKPEWILLDAMVPGYGGEGAQTDWEWAARFVASTAQPVWLAGGIRIDNARQAIAQVRPAGLDVASGAEIQGASTGQKDREKIAELVAACRAGF